MKPFDIRMACRHEERSRDIPISRGQNKRVRNTLTSSRHGDNSERSKGVFKLFLLLGGNAMICVEWVIIADQGF